MSGLFLIHLRRKTINLMKMLNQVYWCQGLHLKNFFQELCSCIVMTLHRLAAFFCKKCFWLSTRYQFSLISLIYFDVKIVFSNFIFLCRISKTNYAYRVMIVIFIVPYVVRMININTVLHYNASTIFVPIAGVNMQWRGFHWLEFQYCVS